MTQISITSKKAIDTCSSASVQKPNCFSFGKKNLHNSNNFQSASPPRARRSTRSDTDQSTQHVVFHAHTEKHKRPSNFPRHSAKSFRQTAQRITPFCHSSPGTRTQSLIYIFTASLFTNYVQTIVRSCVDPRFTSLEKLENFCINMAKQHYRSKDTRNARKRAGLLLHHLETWKHERNVSRFITGWLRGRRQICPLRYCKHRSGVECGSEHLERNKNRFL